MKACSKCKNPKSELDFHKKKTSPDGLRSQCKQCRRENTQEAEAARVRARRWAKVNRKAPLSPEDRKKRQAEALIKSREQDRLRRIQKPEGSRKSCQRWAKRNRASINERRRRLTKTDPRFRVEHSLRARLQHALRARKAKKSIQTMGLLGCPVVWLQVHLESLFKPGMTWENYGPVWHIDHVRPCSSFNLVDPEQQKSCFHWTNLQPLFALENLKKSDTYTA